MIHKFCPNRFILILSLISVLFLQSCVEIVEEVTVNSDRSGKIDLSLNIGKSKGLIGLISQFADLSVNSEIEQEVGEIISVLKQQKGISKVTFEKGRKGSDMRLSFAFDNQKNLNKALYAVSGNEKTIFNPSVYKIKKHKFVKNNMTIWAKLMMEANEDKLPDEMVFDLIEITTIVHLPKPIKSSSGQGTTISADNQTIKASHNISDILEKNINTGIRVKF